MEAPLSPPEAIDSPPSSLSPNRRHHRSRSSRRSTSRARTQTSGQADVCHRCKEPIGSSKLIRVGDYKFCLEHFRCWKCNKRLKQGGFHCRKGKFYCHDDFLKKFIKNCGKCNEPILQGDQVQAFRQYFHADCFVCRLCGKGFEDGKYYEFNNLPYCKQHHFELTADKCFECQEPIADEDLVEIGNNSFHSQCLRCYHCKCYLGETQQNIFRKNNHVFCPKDYQELYARRCTACGDPILQQCISVECNEYYHPQCFKCAVCEEMLEAYICVSGRLRCEEHQDTPMEPLVCSVCGEVVVEEEEVILAAGQQVHTECFVCAFCGDELEKATVKLRDDQLCCPQRCLWENQAIPQSESKTELSVSAELNDWDQEVSSKSIDQDVYVDREESLEAENEVSHHSVPEQEYYEDMDARAPVEYADAGFYDAAPSMDSTLEYEQSYRREADDVYEDDLVHQELHRRAYPPAEHSRPHSASSLSISDSVESSDGHRRRNGRHRHSRSHTSRSRRKHHSRSRKRREKKHRQPPPSEEKGDPRHRHNNASGEHSKPPIEWTRGDLIGKGAFGKVYMAMNKQTGALIAVKQIPMQNKEDQELAKSIESEIKIMSHLRHRNIVNLLETQRSEDKLSILMEFVPGKSLDVQLGSFGALQEPVIKSYTQQLLEALAYCHAQGVVHRDIKGKNILVDMKGHVQLCDFGSAKLFDRHVTTNAPSCTYNYTPLWTAPEVLNGGYNSKVDIWSLGCVVIEMATAKSPWAEKNFQNPYRALYHIGNTNETPKIPETLSPAAQEFLRLCLTRDPERRPPAGELLRHRWIASSSPTGDDEYTIHVSAKDPGVPATSYEVDGQSASDNSF